MARIFLITLAVLSVLLLVLCLRAPKGEEDETGFHPEVPKPSGSPEGKSPVSRSPDLER